jgi:energy-coupling factor transporter ATP-binding protein EcfA2
MQTTGVNSDTLDRFIDGWSTTMVDIWHEKMQMLDVHDTGALMQSVQALPVARQQGMVVISHRFLTYGLYVDAGVGREMGGNRNERGQLVGANGEKIKIRRQAKPWFTPKRFASVAKLRTAVADIYGRSVADTIISALR